MCNWLYHVMLFNKLVWVFLCVCITSKCVCAYRTLIQTFQKRVGQKGNMCAPLGRREGEFMTKPKGEQLSQNKHTVGTVPSSHL